MKKVIKLNESDLTKLVKRIIKENLNEGIRLHYRLPDYLQENNPSSEKEYYITAEEDFGTLKFTPVGDTKTTFFLMDDNACNPKEQMHRIQNYTTVAYDKYLESKNMLSKTMGSLTNKKTTPSEVDWDVIEDLVDQNYDAIFQYGSKNNFIPFFELYDQIKNINNPNIKYKVKVIRQDPASMYDAVLKGNLQNFAKESGIVNYFFNTNMLQVSGNNKVYKIFSMCTAKPIY